MSQERFEALMHAVALETEVDDVGEFFLTGLTVMADLPIRIGFNADQNVCEVLVDLGPLPDPPPEDLLRRLLAHNHDVHEIGDARARYGVHGESGHVTGYVPLGMHRMDDDESGVEMLIECVEDAAFDLEQLWVMQEGSGDGSGFSSAGLGKTFPPIDAPNRELP